MSEIVHDTFRIERMLTASPARVFAALGDPKKKRRWFGESDDHVIESFEHDFSVGGTERLTYRFRDGTAFAGQVITSEGRHLDIDPDKRIVIASTMAFGDRRISASLVSFELATAPGGTLLVLTHQGAFFKGSDGSSGREHGWNVLLDRLEAELGRQ